MSETEEIKERLPIEQVVGRYVPLKRAGRIFRGLCPFHNEKTPSFSVNPERGIYKCFGCGEGGDIFDFTMKIEGLDFREALVLLAEQAGVTLEEKNLPPGGTTGPDKSRLFSLNSYAAKLWHTILTQHPKAEAAREYLKSRGLTEESIKTFTIGYAPLGNVSNTTLRQNNYTPQEIAAAGDPGKFQDRITFPITDITGRVIGFTGRLLELPDDPRSATSRGPKYWNTPETPLFNKSKAVFALSLAKNAISEAEATILAEGQMDVILLHQFGYKNAVASSGTALTSQQLRQIARFSSNLAFAYDGDKAGINATHRGIELALAEELNPYVIQIPHGKDPADCLKSDPEAWKKAYEKRIPFMQWLIGQILDEGEDLTPQRKKDAAKELIPWLRQVKNEIERSDWIRVVASRLQTDEANIHSALQRLNEPSSSPATSTPAIEPKPVPPPIFSALQQRAELGVALVLNFPELYPTIQSQIQDFQLVDETPFIQQFLELFHKHSESPTLEGVLSSLSEGEKKSLYLYAEEVLKPYQAIEVDSNQALSELLIILQRLRSDSKEAAKAEMAQRIRSAQAEGNTEKLKELLLELKNLI